MIYTEQDGKDLWIEEWKGSHTQVVHRGNR
jgi:hypothetical protein